ncbi:MAG: hypothetical protein ACFFD2_05695 [Promethearchaeota archaeon]
MSIPKIWSEFYKCWDYRKKLNFGGDYRILASIFSFIGSWTVALALFEDFEDFLNNN